MRFDVSLLPGQSPRASAGVCVVIDVLRASSSIVTLLDRGAATVVPAESIEAAVALHERLPDHLLCGERGGLPPAGFDYGNSPAEFSRLDLAGKGVILATSNGTRLLTTLASAPAVLVGALLNRSAAARAALRLARNRRLDITVCCSAAFSGSNFVLEDALGAAAVVDAAYDAEPSIQLSDAARFARDAFRTAASDIGAAVASAYHAQELTEAGLGADIAYCARLDISSVAPILERGEDGVARIVPFA